jgi:hypothetical protein
MSDRPQYTVPDNVLTHMLSGVALDTAQLILRTWQPSDGNAVHPGDPFGTVWLWLWRVDQDRAVSLLSNLLWRIRRQEPGATKQITLDALLRGMQLFALQGVQPGELDGLRDKTLQWMLTDHGEDPNSTS